MTIPANLKRRLVAVYGVLALLNLGSWVGAFIAFADRTAGFRPFSDGDAAL